MTEAEILAGVTDALTLAGWRWTHIRRSDGITQGDDGLPDIIATHPTRRLMLLWELKGDGGRPTGSQVAWITYARGAEVDARFVHPDDYDAALAVIFGTATADVTAARAFGSTGSEARTDETSIRARSCGARQCGDRLERRSRRL